MAAENFTGYSTGGAQIANVTITAGKLDCNLTERDDAYVYADKGGAHFGNSFSHLFELTMQVKGSSAYLMYAWCLTNVPESGQFWQTGNSQAIGIACESPSDLCRFNLRENEAADEDPTDLVLGTKYYVTVTRTGVNGETLTAYFRTGSHGGALQDTISVVLPNDRTYQYVHGCSSRDENGGGDVQMEYDVETLDLQEAPPAGVPVHSDYYRRRRAA